MSTTADGVDDAALDLLRTAVRGRVITPADADWGTAHLAWNVAVPQQPAAVVEVSDAGDVVAVVRWAREHGRVVAAQPRGHGATTTLDGAVLLRTAALDEVWVDAGARVARVGAGVRWGEFLPALDGTGLVAMVGSNPDVSVVGYLLGGGFSWFGRAHGYAAHGLRAAEVVDAEGTLRWVTDASDPDLMWALRGGGGDLAIVTRVEIDLHPAAGLVGSSLMFPIQDARAVWGAFLTATRSAPRELTLWSSLMHFPDVPFLPEPIRGRSFVTVASTFLGAVEEAERLLAPIRAAGTVLDGRLAEVPIGRIGEVAAEPTEPTPSIDWCTLLSDLDAEVLDRLIEAAGERDRTSLVAVQLRHLGGAFAEGPSGDRPAGAVADRLGEPYILWGLGIPMAPELVGPIRGSLAALQEAAAPAATGRTPLTLLAGGEDLGRVFDDASLARLRALKVERDPAGTIRGNHPLLGT
jgi:FAD/FMN-containing dehydrogenase